MTATPASLEQRFACRTYSIRLTRKQCVQQRDRAVEGGKSPAGTQARMQHARCRSCPVGEAHARALPAELATLTWPDGAPVELVPEPVIAPARPPVEPKETAMPAPLEITIGDVTDSIEGWARRSKLSPETIRYRLRNGVAGEALVAPARIGRPPKGSTSPAKPKAAKPASASKPKSPELVDEVRAIAQHVDPCELLRRLGFAVDDLGVAPNGVRLLALPPASLAKDAAR